MSRYPRRYDTESAGTLSTAVTGQTSDVAVPSRVSWTALQAATLSTTGVHAAVTDNGTDQTITTSITNPPAARNITATAGGTAADVKAVQVVITGTDISGAALTETLPAFTVNTTGSVTGAKAFKTVTSILIPAHDGTGATTAIGFGDILGLPYKLATNTVLLAALNGTREGTAPTVVASSTTLPLNTVDLNSALNGATVDVWLLV